MQTVELLKSFSDPTRLRLLNLIVNRGPELCVCDLIAVLAQPQSTVSRQLTVLRQCDVVSARREGLWMHYSLCEPHNSMHANLVESLRTPEERQLIGDLRRFDQLKRRSALACCTPQPLNGKGCCTPAET
jgi:ArsR family transcriptional regulator